MSTPPSCGDKPLIHPTPCRGLEDQKLWRPFLSPSRVHGGKTGELHLRHFPLLIRGYLLTPSGCFCPQWMTLIKKLRVLSTARAERVWSKEPRPNLSFALAVTLKFTLRFRLEGCSPLLVHELLPCFFSTSVHFIRPEGRWFNLTLFCYLYSEVTLPFQFSNLINLL